MVTVKNPILAGFCPDPSVCAVGEDFYLAVSSFAYFPGIPIFHTRDFKHIRQIGNALTRPSQIQTAGIRSSQGIFAPTLRYHNGTFYLIVTIEPAEKTFVVTATSPEGPWSEPHFVRDAVGIDPSLLFDDDGQCYYVGNRPNPQGVRFNGDWEIYAARFDLNTMQLCGDKQFLWKGALRSCIWPEGPHLYHIGDWYYLLIAEGGTSFDHCITIARAKSPLGPYEGCPRNPIFTHRHLGRRFPVQCAGHSDLVQDVNGNWYLVMLASRNLQGSSNLGRETFLAKVEWEDGWPVINAGIGMLEPEMTVPLAEHPLPKRSSEIRFDQPELDPRLIFLRVPNPAHWALHPDQGKLRLGPCAGKLSDMGETAYLAIRQNNFDFSFECEMEFSPASPQDAAGLVLFQNERYHLRFEYAQADGESVLRATMMESGEERLIAAEPLCAARLTLRIEQRGLKADCFYDTGAGVKLLAGQIDVSKLCPEHAGGFIGCTAGMYATGKTPAYFSVLRM